MLLVSLTLSILLAQGFPPGAVELLRSGKAPEALEVVREAVAQTPEDDALRRDAVELAFACKRWKDALAWTEGRPAFRAKRAEAAFFAGRYAEAIELLDESQAGEAFLLLDALEALGQLARHDQVLERLRVRLGENHVQVAAALGRVALRNRDYPKATACFARALEQDPWLLEAIFGHGRALVLSGQRDAGRAELTRHRRLVPLFDQLDFAERGVELDASHGPNHARVGDVERQIGRSARAKAAYERGLERTAGNDRTPIVLRLARLLIEDEQDTPQAVELLRAELVSRFDPRVGVRLGDILRDADDLEGARAAYADVLRRRPKDDAVRQRLEQLERMGR